MRSVEQKDDDLDFEDAITTLENFVVIPVPFSDAVMEDPKMLQNMIAEISRRVGVIAETLCAVLKKIEELDARSKRNLYCNSNRYN